jgi:hypothetical protein
LTINAQHFQAKSVQHPFFPPPTVGIFAQIQTLFHQPLELKSSMADQDQTLQVNLILLRLIRYYLFRKSS